MAHARIRNWNLRQEALLFSVVALAHGLAGLWLMGLWRANVPQRLSTPLPLPALPLSAPTVQIRILSAERAVATAATPSHATTRSAAQPVPTEKAPSALLSTRADSPTTAATPAAVATTAAPSPAPNPSPAPATPTQSPVQSMAPSPSLSTPSHGGAASEPAPSAPRFDAAYLQNPAPAYPALARRAGEQGKVVLQVCVEASGIASNVLLHQSSGADRLDQSAMAAVRHWKFIPAQRGTEAIGAWVLVPIVFNLKG